MLRLAIHTVRKQERTVLALDPVVFIDDIGSIGQGFDECLDADRLADVVVHARGKTAFAVAGHSVGGHGYYIGVQRIV